MKLLKVVILVVIFLFIVKCSDDNSVSDAVPYKIEDLNKLPGYGWFYQEYDKYEVDTNIVKLIRQEYNQSMHRILIYSMPSCACPGKRYERFPQFYKILQSVGISNEKVEFYSLSSLRSRHPYDSVIVVTTLPAFYVLKQGKPVYSITDTLDFNIYYGKPYPIKLEELLLEGFKK
ncbi:MAG TPA: hypothetical protein PLU67_10470 [Candidatus Kapabacteria bacterium]|nr:hypothetical protein [Candidatus Kapabacteria bacterium]HOM05898.1 hypothetical protein [Candidatus Kapabacteria bacterium]